MDRGACGLQAAGPQRVRQDLSDGARTLDWGVDTWGPAEPPACLWKEAGLHFARGLVLGAFGKRLFTCVDLVSGNRI